ncbi:MAG: sugar ABC transporter permease, partial [Burkholderiales bacterium]|nr:sugar ABC transporter permease [Anaerolineae bacterium]
MNVEQPLAKPLAARTISFNPITFLGNLSETRYWAYLLILPSLILVSVVVIYPVLSGIRMSFFELRLNRPDLGNEFLGIEHYVDLLNDRTFKVALTNTFWWVVGGVTS